MARFSEMMTWLGQTPYRAAWDLQESTRQAMLSDSQKKGTIFLTEHPPTLTLGRGEDGSSFLKARDWYVNNGFEVIETNRGGKLTYHGPGQIVVYPVIRLSDYRIGVKQYVQLLEKMMIDLCRHFEVAAYRKEGFPGVWVHDKKIGSIGIHVRRHVSIHGFALNINPNLEHIAMISPCGLNGVSMTSVANETGRVVSVAEASKAAMAIFKTWPSSFPEI